MSVTILCTQLPRLAEQLYSNVRDCLLSSRVYLLSNTHYKSYNWLYSRGNIQNIYQSAFYATDHSKLLLNVELEMDAGHSEPGFVSCWAFGSFETSWGRVWGGSEGKGSSTDTFQYWNHWHGHTSTFILNISPDNISFGLLLSLVLTKFLQPLFLWSKL